MRSAVAFVSLVVLGSLAFTACGGDDDSFSSVGGSAGAKAGKSGGAGKGSAGEPSAGGAGEGGANSLGGGSGKGGSGARGGHSGTGGSSTGGTNATGGTGTGGTNATGGTNGGGTSGSGGSGALGSSGDGTGGGGEGGGPEAGGAGQGGQGGTVEPHAAFCSYHCTDSNQCGQGSICNDAGLCVSALARPLSCDADDECTPAASFWGPECTSDADCAVGTQACVAVGGVGQCAFLADSPCFSGAPAERTKFGSTDQVSVCTVPGVCQRHACATTCAVDTDCFGGTGPTCNTTTHFCGGCTAETDCFGAGVSHCDVPTGMCQCASNDDCTGTFGIPGTDTCVNGTCGCSSASLCTAYPDATIACE
jgi:hypothetical protein